MITIRKKVGAAILPFVALAVFSSCNKDVKQFPDLPAPAYVTGGMTIAKTLQSTPSDSLYYKMVVRAGMVSLLNDSSRNFTMFVTDNNGMKLFVNAASGGAIPLAAPDAVFAGFISSTLPVASAAGIVQYNTVAQAYPFASIPSTFPNTPLPTQIIPDPNSGFFHLPIFPVRKTPYSYVNNLPVIATDEAASNGIIHHVYSVVTPPSATLKTMIAAEPTLSYFRAAIARADSGQTGLNRFDSLLNYGVTNMTVLAPNDVAFQNFIYGVVYSQTLAATSNPVIAAATASGAVAAGPAFLSTNNVSTALVRGVMAYHFIAAGGTTAASFQPTIRVFAEDLPPASPTAPFFLKTLVNASIVSHPGIIASATFTGPAVTSLKFTGLGPLITPSTPPYSGTPANAVSFDKNAANGVYHILDAVLTPQ